MKRIYYLDWLRVIAIIGVIFIHCSSLTVITCPREIFPYFINSFGRFAVPVFVMISGVLFLNKNIGIKKLYSKYILKFAVCILAFEFLAFLTKFFNWENVVIIKVHLWFLYMIMGIYMVYPFLKKIVSSQKLCLYFVGLSLIYVFIIPFLIKFTSGFSYTDTFKFLTYFTDKSYLHLPLGFSVYFVLGYLLHKYDIKKYFNNIVLYFAAVISLGMITFSTMHIAVANGQFSEYLCDYNYIFVLTFAVSVFLIFKNHEVFNRENKVISFLSRYTFCIYLVHMIVLGHLRKIEPVLGYDFKTDPFMVINIVITFCLSLVLALIINKIPVLNKYFI